MQLPRLGSLIRRRSKTGLREQETAARPEDALRAQMRRLTRVARKYARGRVGDAADDVLQEAFMTLWQVAYASGKATPEGDTDKLFYRILRRRIVDELRGLSRREELDDHHVLDLASYIEANNNVARVAEAKIMSERVDYLIAAMPDKMRSAFLMHRDGHDAHDIAGALQVSYETARWHVAEARNRLRKQLDTDGYELPAPRSRGQAGVEE